MKRVTLLFLLTVSIGMTLSSCVKQQNIKKQEGVRWSEQKVAEWYSVQPWLVGCDYIPASAINQIEMWQSSTFDAPQIEKELGWAEGLGFNTMRVYLSSVVWTHEAAQFKANMDSFLKIAEKHHIRPLFVFFDDCWNAESSFGVQPKPKAGIHNSGWVQDPSVSLRQDTATLYPQMEAYVKDVLTTFKADQRILMWDLYNEPGNREHGISSLPLLKKVFEWAHDVNPSQPISSGVWNHMAPITAFQLNHSDVITYHNYLSQEKHQTFINDLKLLNRPLICTEYMARKNNSTFETIMPMLQKENVGAINWGFVSGKTNTIFAWGTPLPDLDEPEVWFHDILRQDGTPFDPKEIALIRSLTGK